MSEKLHRELAPEAAHEKGRHHETDQSKHEQEAAKKHEAAIRDQESSSSHDLETIRHNVSQEAKRINHIEIEEKSKPYRPTESLVNNELKGLAYHRLLNRTRRHLKAPEKLVSKIIHQPIVDAVSEKASKTIARPSGILGGGIFAFVGTSAHYYLTKYYGYDYNFFIFVFLLLAGFITGWIVELLIKLLLLSRR